MPVLVPQLISLVAEYAPICECACHSKSNTPFEWCQTDERPHGFHEYVVGCDKIVIISVHQLFVTCRHPRSACPIMHVSNAYCDAHYVVHVAVITVVAGMQQM